MVQLAGAIVLLGEFLPVAKSWAVRIGVLSSLHNHLVLVRLAENRRHQASGYGWISPLNATLSIDMVEKFVIAKLFTGRPSREQQLVAFWLPFLLILVSRPDNISSFHMEETVFSVGQLMSAAAVALGAVNALYTHVALTSAGAGTLVTASVIMYYVGLAKYMERIFALMLGNLSRIKSAIKKKQPARFSFHHPGGRGPLDNEQALLVAHSMFHITKCAFCDCSVDMDPRDREAGRKTLSRGWESACKVVEMELSLMYDVIYTKAVVIHTWPGYIIRIASPPLIAAALLLFWFYDKDPHTRVDIVITYMLLVSTLLLNVRWLLGALGSTWAYTFLKDSRWQLLKDAVADDGGRWHRLRAFVVSMDLSRMPFFSDMSRLPLNSRYREPPSTWFDMKPPSSYRLWPGVLGQYNLLHECTRHKGNPFRRFMKRFMSEHWMEYKHHNLEGFRIPQDVKGLLFERIWEKLKSSYTPRKVEAEEEEEEGEDVLRFDPDELQEAILIWHMATSIFLQRSSFEDEESRKYVKLTSKLSDYMVFLVAVRPGMLPARKHPSKFEATSKALEGLLDGGNSNRPAAGSKTRTKQKLAFILQQMDNLPNGNGSRRSSVVLSDGSQYAGVLRSCLEEGRYPELVSRMGEKSYARFKRLMPRLCRRPSELVTRRELLNLILDAWVRLLMNASRGSTRESHAKQLGRGGDLVTVVWILTKHTGVFGIEDEDG